MQHLRPLANKHWQDYAVFVYYDRRLIGDLRLTFSLGMKPSDF